MRQGIDVGVMGRASSVAGSSVVDSNRFYSMLLDARTVATVSESMHDVSERLLKGEKDNAKSALDQLWALKKTLSDDESGDTIETLIAYYQEKINVLRDKEEAIKKVNRETRALIEEKRKNDEELAAVKSEIGACARELKELDTKVEALKKREGELSVSERMLRAEICANESVIVSGLQDIILRLPAGEAAVVAPAAVRVKQEPVAVAPKPVAAPATVAAPIVEAPKPAIADLPTPAVIKGAAKPAAAPAPKPAAAEAPKPAVAAPAPPSPYYEDEPIPIYPKSVVRMGGKVIGEYYHDGNVTPKEERHYIYNSSFMSDRLTSGLRALKSKPVEDVHSELVKIAEDAANRVRDNEKFHFEVSTNEIINDKNLRELSADLRRKAWDEVEEFAVKLSAKIEALGVNYEGMLQEQMARCAERE